MIEEDPNPIEDELYRERGRRFPGVEGNITRLIA
jgi:hypothetical protein